MVAVTYPMLQQWTVQDDISIPDLEAASAQNDGESYFVRKMSEIIGFADDSTSQMYVVSKADGMFGATAVLDDAVQSRLQDIFPEGYYILLLHRLPPCFLANLLLCEMPKRYTCSGPKSVPKSKRNGPKNVSGKISFPNPYFWQVPTCHKALIYQASGYFPKSSCFLKTNLSIFWGTPHYSPRGTFLYPET